MNACTILEPTRWPAGEDKIILSIDDGPNLDNNVTPRILEVLAHHGVKAAFCFVGRRAERHPAIVKSAADNGHSLVIHGYERSWPTFWDYDVLAADYEKAVQVLRQATEVPDLKVDYYRPPRGLVTPSVRKLIDKKALKLAYLTFYVHEAPSESKESKAKLNIIKGKLKQHRGGAIVFHENRYRHTPGRDGQADKSWLPEALDKFILWAKSQGFSFVQYHDEENY